MTAKRRFNWLAIVLAIVFLSLGFAGGAQWMRLRQRSRDIMFAVNGTTIDKNTLFHRLDTTAGTDVIHKIIQEELLLQFVKQKGLAPTEAQVEAKYVQAVADSGFARMLAVTRLTPEDVKRAMRLELSQEAIYGQGVKASDQEILAFYKANSDKRNPNAVYYKPETVTVAIIVTGTEAQGRKARASLEEGGDFATVAQNFSADTSKNNGGLLPPIRRGQPQLQKIPGLAETIFGLKIGATTGPKHLAGAWWIIRCVDKTAETTKPFAEVKDDCRRGVLVTKGAPINTRKMETELAEFRDKATIQAFRPEYEMLARLKQ